MKNKCSCHGGRRQLSGTVKVGHGALRVQQKQTSDINQFSLKLDLLGNNAFLLRDE